MKNSQYYIATIILLLSTLSFPLLAQNPIVPPGVFIADPSAHLWKDGKIYVYGSRDESPDYYCSFSYDVLSSSDLKKWSLVTNSFASKGPLDAISYSNAPIYAPDAQYYHGKYYLYYCLAQQPQTEGVATSSSPNGPFMNGRPINVGNYEQIDPCVFIDDDGQAYYIWGQFNAKVAKLNKDMKSINVSTIKENVVTQNEHHFHEGGYMIKRNGIYYFIYTDISRADMPTCLGYSTGPTPYGPFKYRGVIIDNDHCDPGNWNNHGSIVKFKDHWYVFYHRSTHGSNTMRTACVEPIHFNKDGSIDEVPMTSQGAANSFNYSDTLLAYRACLLYGHVRIDSIAPGEEGLSKINNNDKAAFKYLDFKGNVNDFEVNLIPGKSSGKVEVALDNSWGPTIAEMNVEAALDDKPITLHTKVKTSVNGSHTVWLRFITENENTFKIIWFKFNSLSN